MKSIITQSAVVTVFALGSLVALAPLAFAETTNSAGVITTQIENDISPDNDCGTNGRLCPNEDNSGNNECGTDGRLCPNVNNGGNNGNPGDNNSDNSGTGNGDNGSSVNGGANGSINDEQPGLLGWTAGWNVWNFFGSDDNDDVNNDCGTNGRLCPNEDNSGNNGGPGPSNDGKNINGNDNTGNDGNINGNNEVNGSVNVENRGFFRNIVWNFLNLF
ncbi:MAG: hypothetical protein Q8P36_02875 [bacterium]|nr:hypothetical protein [bacterium]